MKWNWFSPLPPAESGIADYTASLLPLLASHAEITLWTNREGWDPRWQRHAKVRVADGRTLQRLHEADLNFYHIGNNPEFHGWIWDIAHRHPGVMVLHDLHLQHLFYGLYVHYRGARGRYLNLMGRSYGNAGREAASALLRGHQTLDVVSQAYPLAVHAVEKALAAVVHTPGALEDLSGCHHLPVVHAPLPHDPVGARSVRTRPALVPSGGEPIRLVLVGHINSNRRLKSILSALASFPARDRFRLDVYGAVTQQSLFEGQIATSGLSGQATLHGFVPDEVLDEELRNCDLAFNLRFPSMGECSLSQLRYWEHALPTLVTPTGWYGTLPEEVVGYVNVASEEADIHHHLQGLLSEPEKYRRMGENGRARLLQHHSSSAYVEAIKAVAERLPALRHQFMARQLADRVGRVVGQWGAGTAAEAVYSRAATQILALAPLRD